MLNRKLIMFPALLIVVAALLLVALSGTADAARGGRGGGKGGGGTTVTYTGTCVAMPNPVAIWDNVSIVGSGAAPNTYVGYTLSFPGGVAGGWVTADANGNFGLRYQTFVQGTTTVTFGAVAKCSFAVN